MTTQQAPAVCPRCQRSGLMSPNQDGDWCCMCGHVVYSRLPAPVLVREHAPAPRPLLSPRQAETLTLLAEGLTNREIAARMGLTSDTVKANLRAIKDRLQVESREQLRALGKQGGGWVDVAHVR